MAWGWACRFADRSSKPITAACGRPRPRSTDRCFRSNCRPGKSRWKADCPGSSDPRATGGVMRLDKVLVSLTLTVCLASTAFAATIAGNVRGPDGKPFMGAFVVAENMRNKMTVSVLSNAQGRYHIGDLPAATYRVQINAIGFKSDPRTDVGLTGDQNALFDFA